MKEVMTNAWRIAKRAARFYCGKAVEFFAESLKIAWVEFKKEELNANDVIATYVSKFNTVFNTEEYAEYGASAKTWNPSAERTRIYITDKRNKAAKIWVELLKTNDTYRVTYDVRSAKNSSVIASVEMFVDHLENVFE